MWRGPTCLTFSSGWTSRHDQQDPRQNDEMRPAHLDDLGHLFNRLHRSQYQHHHPLLNQVVPPYLARCQWSTLDQILGHRRHQQLSLRPAKLIALRHRPVLTTEGVLTPTLPVGNAIHEQIVWQVSFSSPSKQCEPASCPSESTVLTATVPTRKSPLLLTTVLPVAVVRPGWHCGELRREDYHQEEDVI